MTQWKDVHKSECKNLEKFKEEWKDIDSRRLEILVHHCLVCEKEGDETTILRRCSKCKLPKYCSTECQVHHWKTGHKAECSKAFAEFKDAQDLIENLNVLIVNKG
jgi:hypothetical protein